MAVPKKKTSPSRRNKRRKSFKLSPVASVTCPNCLEPKQPHRVCECGYYNGRQVFQPATKDNTTTPANQTA